MKKYIYPIVLAASISSGAMCDEKLHKIGPSDVETTESEKGAGTAPKGVQKVVNKIVKKYIVESGKENKKKRIKGVAKKDSIKDVNPYKKVKELEIYQNIKYSREGKRFALYDHSDKNEFLKILGKTPHTAFKRMFNSKSTFQSTALTAYAYDYGYHRPDIAQGFYKSFPASINDLPLSDKFRQLDFYLVTGQYSRILGAIKGYECNTLFGRNGDKCRYYIGAAKYLLTGNRKNIELRIAAGDGFKPAQDIIKGRK